MFFHPLFVNDAPKEGTAQNPKATETERQSHSSQQAAKPQRSLILQKPLKHIGQ
jgi:hypothetical protein